MRSRSLACCVLVGMMTVAAAGCGEKKRKPSGEGLGAPVRGLPVTAAVAEVRLEPVDVLAEAVGTVRSKTTSVLSSKVVGNVTAVHVRPGEQVEAGKLLVEISSGDVSAQVDKAQAGAKGADAAKKAADANRDLAKATFDRFQTLLERKSVSPQEFDEAQARFKTAVAEASRAEQMLQSARAEVADAEARYRDTRIVAPAAGFVVKKNVDVGDQAAPGLALLTIEDNRNYRLEVAAGESLARQIRIGDPATVTMDALGGAVQATVAEIVPAIAPASRSFLVKLDLPPHKDLRSGMYGKAAFAVGKRPAVLLPAAAFIERGELVCAYSVDSDNIARLRLVTTGKRTGDRVEVLSGLSPGERVVVGDTGRVQDGISIQPGNEERPSR